MNEKNYTILIAEELAAAGNNDAMLELIRNQFHEDNNSCLSGDNEKILRYLHILAEGGNGYAMRHIGNIYNRGSGVEQNYMEAKKWYERAAEKLDTYAICTLGYIYYYGKGVEVDYEKAYKYFSQAAFMKNVNAIYKLGDMFYFGVHVKEDKNAAFFWYDEANSYDCHDYEQASIDYRLGKCYLYGHGTEQDLPEALGYLSSAEKSLVEQLQDGNPYGVADLILPNVIKELDIARSMVRELIK